MRRKYPYTTECTIECRGCDAKLTVICTVKYRGHDLSIQRRALAGKHGWALQIRKGMLCDKCWEKRR